MSTRLFVGNVPEIICENDIKDAFSKYGQIVNVDLKYKPGGENEQIKFAFVTLTASNYEVESCIKHFSNEDLGGRRLYVTRARESFLERLQRERQETQRKEEEKDQYKALPKKNPVLKLSDKLNPRKRKIETPVDNSRKPLKLIKPFENKTIIKNNLQYTNKVESEKQHKPEKNKKQQDSDKKRIESIIKKRQEFKEKQMIIKSGLVGIDKIQNKKVIFSDNNEDDSVVSQTLNAKEGNKINSLFDDEESDDDVNFKIKKQFEGKKGQKVLDLQSRFKSDKRFILDERFLEGEQSEEEKEETNDNDDQIELGNADEKTKQLNILQDVLGVTIRTHTQKNYSAKTKSKLGMLRFDPMQPEHAKFLAPVADAKQEHKTKLKKRITEEKQKELTENIKMEEQPKVEVSKEQFYKVSDTLKETLEQPAIFSLRSLFGQNEEKVNDASEQNCIPLVKPKEPKIKNPLDLTEKNPFIYDSSDSETEEFEANIDQKNQIPKEIETKAVWKENLFFTQLDARLIDGLAFFNKSVDNEVQKERRELKSVMKKRIYNKERKNQMFQKKIGGRKKSVKKAFKKT